MPEFALTGREAALVHAALSADPATAVRAWESWAESVVLEKAPHAELRLLPRVYFNLSKVAPDLPLPEKLRGKARATFTFNRLISHEALPALKALTKVVPVMVAKGAAFCGRFDAWSYRPMGDIDIHVQRRHLSRSVDVLTAMGWTPKYGMTPASLKYRTPLRRNSWNLTRQRGDIDLHWRLLDGATGKKAAGRFWDTAEASDFLGVPVLVPSPEFAVVGSMQHGFAEGTRADVLQAVIDCWSWLPVCDWNKLAQLLSLTGTADFAKLLAEIFDSAELPLDGLASKLPSIQSPTKRPRAVGLKIRRDKRVVRHRRLYRLWERLGRRCGLERLILRYFGPFSRPLVRLAAPRLEYDLRDCSVMDEIGGPGWGWPEPEHTCFWSDQADNRLLVTVPDVQDYVAILSVSTAAQFSPRPKISVVVNGRPVRKLKFRSEGRTEFAILVPRSYLFGPWIEFSFRPRGFGARPFSAYGQRRSIPAVRLQILPADSASAALAVRDPTPLQ